MWYKMLSIGTGIDEDFTLQNAGLGVVQPLEPNQYTKRHSRRVISTCKRLNHFTWVGFVHRTDVVDGKPLSCFRKDAPAPYLSACPSLDNVSFQALTRAPSPTPQAQ